MAEYKDPKVTTNRGTTGNSMTRWIGIIVAVVVVLLLLGWLMGWFGGTTDVGTVGTTDDPATTTAPADTTTAPADGAATDGAVAPAGEPTTAPADTAPAN